MYVPIYIVYWTLNKYRSRRPVLIRIKAPDDMRHAHEQV